MPLDLKWLSKKKQTINSMRATKAKVTKIHTNVATRTND